MAAPTPHCPTCGDDIAYRLPHRGRTYLIERGEFREHQCAQPDLISWRLVECTCEAVVWVRGDEKREQGGGIHLHALPAESPQVAPQQPKQQPTPMRRPQQPQTAAPAVVFSAVGSAAIPALGLFD